MIKGQIHYPSDGHFGGGRGVLSAVWSFACCCTFAVGWQSALLRVFVSALILSFDREGDKTINGYKSEIGWLVGCVFVVCLLMLACVILVECWLLVNGWWWNQMLITCCNWWSLTLF